MSALTASPMVADPYATPPLDTLYMVENGAHIAIRRNDGPRRRMRDRLSDDDRAELLRIAHHYGYNVAKGCVGTPADDFAHWRRPAMRTAIACTTYDLRPSELAWIDAVGGVLFLAAKLNAAADLI